MHRFPTDQALRMISPSGYSVANTEAVFDGE
ncbi:hypothetical protein ABH927_004224 [Planotetraspora sp. GP83]